MGPLAQKNEHFTYADYASWHDEKRYELIDGAVHAMEPGPMTGHQGVCIELSWQLKNFLRDHPEKGKVFSSPFDVRLNADQADDTVVQPDLVIVCDPSILDRKCCRGVPDMLVEILSPSTAGRDRTVKLNKYLQAGVKEYWIVDQDTKTVQVFILQDRAYTFQSYTAPGLVPVHTLEGCEINLQDVFSDVY